MFDLSKLLETREKYESQLPTGPMPVYPEGATKPMFTMDREIANHCGFQGSSEVHADDPKYSIINRTFLVAALYTAHAVYELHGKQLLPHSAFGEDTNRFHIQLGGMPFVIRYHGPSDKANVFPSPISLNSEGSNSDNVNWNTAEKIMNGFQRFLNSYSNFDPSLLDTTQDNEQAYFEMPSRMPIDDESELWFLPPINPRIGKPDKRYSYRSFRGVEEWTMATTFASANKIHPDASARERSRAKREFGIYK